MESFRLPLARLLKMALAGVTVGCGTNILEKGGRAGQSAEGDFGMRLFEAGAKATLPDLAGTWAQQGARNGACPTEP